MNPIVKEKAVRTLHDFDVEIVRLRIIVLVVSMALGTSTWVQTNGKRAAISDRITMQRGLNAEADDANELREKRGTRRPSVCEPTAEDIAKALDERIRYAMLVYPPLIRLRHVDQCIGEVTASDCAKYDVAQPFGVIDIEDVRETIRWGFSLDTMRAWIRAAQPNTVELLKTRHGENW